MSDKLLNFNIVRFSSFVGGHLVVEDLTDGGFWCGQISKIDIDLAGLAVTIFFTFAVFNHGTISQPHREFVAFDWSSGWRVSSSEYHLTGLTAFGGAMLSARSKEHREIGTFYPPGYDE